MSSPTLTEFGAKIKASNQREQCQAFDENADRCPYKRQEGSQFCPDCDESSALVTVAKLRSNRPGNKGYIHIIDSVKDTLCDDYGFSPLDALVLASSSVISTCYVLEGRLAWAAKEGEETFAVCGHEYSVERGRELLDQIRAQVSSSTFIEKWDSVCLAVGRGKIRCSNPAEAYGFCSFHQELDDDEIRIDDHLSVYGPAGAGDSR